MSSRRALSLATSCLKLRAALESQQPVFHQLLSRPNLPSNIPKPHQPFLTSIRQKHTIPRPPPPSTPTGPQTSTIPPSSNPTPPASNPTSAAATPSDNNNNNTDPGRSPPPPQYELTFTCVPCGTRSKHKVSKQGYHHGTVLIACPGCKNRHVIADHLKIFGDRRVTVEDLMREKGQLVKRGTLDGDMEFWEDGTTTAREEDKEEGKTEKGGGSNKGGEAADTAPPGASFKN